MRKSLLVFAAVVLAACSTMKSDSGLGNAKLNLTSPEIYRSQLSSVPPSARHVEGGLPVQYKLRVANKSGETITLKRITVQSMGVGAYDVPPTSRPFSTVIQPDQYQEVDFWIPANVSDATVVGANGPVTLRATLQLDSPVGQFQEVVV